MSDVSRAIVFREFEPTWIVICGPLGPSLRRAATYVAKSTSCRLTLRPVFSVICCATYWPTSRSSGAKPATHTRSTVFPVAPAWATSSFAFDGSYGYGFSSFVELSTVDGPIWHGVG